MSKNKHILITGGGGYIGSVLVPFLISKKYKVTVIDRFFGLNYKIYKNLKIIKDDVQNINSTIFKKIDCVVDLVAIAMTLLDYFKIKQLKQIIFQE